MPQLGNRIGPIAAALADPAGAILPKINHGVIRSAQRAPERTHWAELVTWPHSSRTPRPMGGDGKHPLRLLKGEESRDAAAGSASGASLGPLGRARCACAAANSPRSGFAQHALPAPDVSKKRSRLSSLRREECLGRKSCHQMRSRVRGGATTKSQVPGIWSVCTSPQPHTSSEAVMRCLEFCIAAVKVAWCWRLQL